MPLVGREVGAKAKPLNAQASGFSASMVNRVVKKLANRSKSGTRQNWLQAVAAKVNAARPDIADAALAILEVSPADEDVLSGLSIGEIGVCYEALLSTLDSGSRRNSGQFFTPDDAAHFMAMRSKDFGDGVWLDPCCGVGNLSWHLTQVQDDPSSFIRTNLVLIDQDEVALRTAVALIAAEYAAPGDSEAADLLLNHAHRRDFLARKALPTHDFVIVNPPYAYAPKRNSFETGDTRDLFAYFMEQIVKTSRGFIAVTPASYLSAPKFASLRKLLDRECSGGDVLVFDNVPDTLFRGYKFGSNNTSKTNFVRAAITLVTPQAHSWRVSPILRWQAAARGRMFEGCQDLLSERRLGPNGEWVKIGPGLGPLWDRLSQAKTALRDLAVSGPTQYALEVPQTPRYYISATFRPLNRSSKAILYFANEHDRDRAALVLNSSIPYLWWRGLDGGVTLPKRVLLSVPVPDFPTIDPVLIGRLRASESEHLVVKLNAGKPNENVKHPPKLVEALNDAVLPSGVPRDLSLLYANNMF